jgi:hypothetical protein
MITFLPLHNGFKIFILINPHESEIFSSQICYKIELLKQSFVNLVGNYLPQTFVNIKNVYIRV